MDKIAIYPGSFDPVTNGHIDLINRGAKIFTTLIVAIANNPRKRHLFSLEERLDMVKRAASDIEGVEVRGFDTLLTCFAESCNAHVILRGIRAFSDFDNEFQMALLNRKLASGLETVFMIPDESYSYISSRMVKEIASYGGSIKELVPQFVEARLMRKLKARNKAHE